MKKLNLRIEVAIITLLLPLIAHSELLRLNFKQGDQYKIRANINITTSISKEDSTTSITIKILTDNLYKVRGINKQGYDVDMALTRIQTNLESPKKLEKNIAFTFDTDSVEFSDSLAIATSDNLNSMKEVGLMFKYMTGVNIPINIASNGKILKSDNMNEALKPAIAYMNRRLARLNIPADSIAKFKAKQKQLLKQTDLSYGYEKSFITFPEKPINQGDTWQVISTVPNDTASKIILTYKLLEITKNEYIIELVSGESAKAPTNNFFAGLFKLNIGVYKAIYHLDKTTCRVKNAEGSLSMSIIIGEGMDNKKAGTSSNNSQNKGLQMLMNTSFKIVAE